MLQASLKHEEDKAQGRPSSTSPLSEADPDSLTILFDRVNRKLLGGMPEAISVEDELVPLVLEYRKRRNLFLLDEERKAQKEPRKKASPKSKTTEPNQTNVSVNAEDDLE